MRKLIATTQNGTEFFHSKENAFFCDSNAQKIADILNKNKYKIKEGEHWHIYDYDFTHDMYTDCKIYITNKGAIKAKRI